MIEFQSIISTRRLAATIVIVALGGTLPGCTESQRSQKAAGRIPGNADVTTEAVAHAEKLPEAAGLHNLWRVAANSYSGSEPHAEEGFASLAKLGIKTVISVDGARPNLEAAAKHGMKYVHIPTG